MSSVPLANSSPEIGLLREAYAAFNARNIDAAVPLMNPDVTWPRAFKGGFVCGSDAVRAYWTEQWSEINPTVEPLAFYQEDAGKIVVDVHQIVRDMAGTILADERAGHRFTIEHGLIRGMEVCSLPSTIGFNEPKDSHDTATPKPDGAANCSKATTSLPAISRSTIMSAADTFPPQSLTFVR